MTGRKTKLEIVKGIKEKHRDKVLEGKKVSFLFLFEAFFTSCSRCSGVAGYLSVEGALLPQLSMGALGKRNSGVIRCHLEGY